MIGSRLGGDRYYDDNAWVGLGLVQLERLRPGRGHVERARSLFRFAIGGWDARPEAPSPGGVFWVEQNPPARGAGTRNHDRNVVSNAPNAQLGLHLAEVATATGGAGGAELHARAHDMYTWVNVTLDAGRDTGAPATGLFFDKLRGDGTIDETLRTYNQGSMIGANVLLARQADRGAPYLARAEAIAAKALRHYSGSYESQPAAFNAILFRNLLGLHAATADEGLRRAHPPRHVRLRRGGLGHAARPPRPLPLRPRRPDAAGPECDGPGLRAAGLGPAGLRRAGLSGLAQAGSEPHTRDLLPSGGPYQRRCAQPMSPVSEALAGLAESVVTPGRQPRVRRRARP